MKQSRLASITLALNIGTCVAAVMAWSNTLSGRSISLIAIAGLLGLIAFSLMWVHFVSDAIRDTWLAHESAGKQYSVTRWIILVAILLHPSLIVLYLYQNEYGLPPGSYQAYVGDIKAPFIFFGVFALTIFLAFECKRFLVKHNLWRYVLHANFLAMFAIVIHGFRLGSVMESAWYFALWCLYATSLTVVAVWWYIRYYKTMPIRKIIAIIVVIILGVTATVTALQVLPKSADTSATQPTTTTQQTAKTINRNRTSCSER